ncbi:MAG TPA: hypothetical protein VGA64_04125 [Candidatus Polarisedimenticolia bacterium]
MLLIHAAATLFMVGVIWFVQVIHYPLFTLVGREQFPAYAARHQRRALALLGVPMVAELVSAVALTRRLTTGPGRGLAMTGLALLALIWISTAALQIPRHLRLLRGFDPAVQRGLLISNWLRTVAWTARGFIALAMMTCSVG